MKIAFTLDVEEKYGGLHFGIENRIKALKSVGVEADLMPYGELAGCYEQYDLIYSSNYLKWYCFSKMRPHIKNYPHIVELHGWVIPDLQPGQELAKDTYNMLKDNKIVMTTSNAIGNILKKTGLNVEVCWNSFDTEMFPYSDIDSDNPLLNLANVSIPKGFDRIYEFIDNTDYKCGVVGRIERSSAGVPVTEPYHKNITYHGKIPHEELPTILKKSSIFLHLSRFESCPLTIQEAMGVGLPVICTDAGDNKELVGTAGIVIKNPRDWSYERKIADRVWKCYLNPGGMESILSETKEAVSKIYSNFDKYRDAVKTEREKFFPKVIGKKLKAILENYIS